MFIQGQKLILSGVTGSVKNSLIQDWLMRYCKIKTSQEESMKTALVTADKCITFFTIGLLAQYTTGRSQVVLYKEKTSLSN